MEIDELLEHYQYKLTCDLTPRSKRIAEATCSKLKIMRQIYDAILEDENDGKTYGKIYRLACNLEG